jgi:hypothetical protein
MTEDEARRRLKAAESDAAALLRGVGRKYQEEPYLLEWFVEPRTRALYMVFVTWMDGSASVVMATWGDVALRIMQSVVARVNSRRAETSGER